MYARNLHIYSYICMKKHFWMQIAIAIANYSGSFVYQATRQLILFIGLNLPTEYLSSCSCNQLL